MSEKLKIDLFGWIGNNLAAQIILAPFFYAIYEYQPFGVGVVCGIAGMTWLIILIFWLAKRNGIEIK